MTISRIKRIELILVASIILTSILISLIPTIYNIWRTPKNTFYSLAYNYIPDYYQFISFMRDGKDGQFALTSRFTPEIFTRKFGHVFFSMLGFIGSRLGLNLFTTFTLARIFLGIIRLTVLYYLIRFFFQEIKTRILAFVLILILPSFFYLNITNNHLDLISFLPGITNFDVFRRITFLPHHLFANILMILFFPIFARALEKDKKFISLAAGILLMIAAIVNPATIINIFFIFSVAFFILWLGLYRKNFIYIFKHFALTTIPLGFAIVYYQFYLFTEFPWNNFYQGELTAPRIWTLSGYLGLLGLAWPLAIIGLFGKKPASKALYIMIVSWAFAPIAGFYIALRLPFLSAFRIFQAQQFIPLGLLASYGIFGIYERFKRRLTIFLLTLVITAISLPYYYLSLKTQLQEVSPLIYNVFIPIETIRSFQYLDQNTPKESVVMAGYFTGQMLPAFTHNRVFIGHGDGTYDYANKLDQLRIFYSGNQSIPQVQDFLNKSNISYILFTPDTPNPSSHIISKLPNVELIYTKGNNYIYKIIK